MEIIKRLYVDDFRKNSKVNGYTIELTDRKNRLESRACLDKYTLSHFDIGPSKDLIDEEIEISLKGHVMEKFKMNDYSKVFIDFLEKKETKEWIHQTKNADPIENTKLTCKFVSPQCLNGRKSPPQAPHYVLNLPLTLNEYKRLHKTKKTYEFKPILSLDNI